MNEAWLTAVEQIEPFLRASSSMEFSAAGDDDEWYGHISHVRTPLGHPGRKKHERGVLWRYLQYSGGYSRGQATTPGEPVAV